MTMNDSNNILREEYTIDTPENITFGYEIAGIGSRFIGALVDSLILGVALLLLNILIGVLLAWTEGPASLLGLRDDADMSWVGGLLMALYALLNFALFWGYYIIFEWLWNGQTPGKRVAHARVVRMDGNPAGFIEVVVRNLVRIIDFLPGVYGLGLVTMFFNRRARRLGDFAAGTLVIKEQRSLRLENLGSLSAPPQTPVNAPLEGENQPYLQRFPHIRQLSAADVDLIQDALRRYAAGKVDGQLMQRLAAVMALKLDVTVPEANNNLMARNFLQEVAEAARHG